MKFYLRMCCLLHTNQKVLVECMIPEYVLLAQGSNCMFACACANCQTPDATVIFAL